jgi:oligoribonuclease (3'-5' exoribonuclease)
MERPLIFMDTETTSLDRRTRRIWDLAYIKRWPNGNEAQTQWFVETSLENADPMSLAIGRYYDRHPRPYGPTGRVVTSEDVLSEEETARTVAVEFRDALIVGAVPSFDEESLADMLHRHGLVQTWHYHLIDVETLAAGRWQIKPPWDFDKILAQSGLGYHEDDRHTALGDALMVRDLYDAVLGATD